MNLKQLFTLIQSDLYRYAGNTSLKSFFKYLFLAFGMPGFRYTFFVRTCKYFSGRKLLLPVYLFTRLLHLHFSYRYGIWIHPQTKIGHGLLIGHFGGIVINKQVQIGCNVGISHGVTIGQANRGKRKGVPIIGDNVYIGPGACIIGNTKVGNDVAIGANSVVLDDVPDSAVVAGNPATVVSHNGSTGYNNRCWPPTEHDLEKS